MIHGHQYLESFIGSTATKDIMIDDKVVIWMAAVETFSRITDKCTQKASAGFIFCLQNEWLYVQCVVADIGANFGTLEQIIRTFSLLSPIGTPSCKIDGAYHKLPSQQREERRSCGEKPVRDHGNGPGNFESNNSPPR